ncbi:hypothetical protein [Mucisphaera calidilacus]|uniref:Uncharacterized protein n=1 Tax=Mucisphaera calidilacus TaxID=2527982 RepID=A0A518BWK6_9BACT|nr:hypothetical protein [Mucisphaera calidilacus]QDU71351.1 hypothetical protein Pan265_12000 [Mucisphaera calidilacus]
MTTRTLIAALTLSLTLATAPLTTASAQPDEADIIIDESIVQLAQADGERLERELEELEIMQDHLREEMESIERRREMIEREYHGDRDDDRWEHDEDEWDEEDHEYDFLEEIEVYARLMELVEMRHEIAQNASLAGVAAVMSVKEFVHEPEDRAAFFEKALREVKDPTIKRAILQELLETYGELDAHDKAHRVLWHLIAGDEDRPERERRERTE